MARSWKPQMTPEQYSDAIQRSGQIKEALRKEGIPVYMVAALIHVNPASLYVWLREGLSIERYEVLKTAIAKLSAAHLLERQGAVR